MKLFASFGLINFALAQSDKICRNDHEYWDDCGTACEAKCGDRGVRLCIDVCQEGCFCEKGFIRNHRGECIPEGDCDDFLANSECFRQRDEADANTDMMMVGHFTPSCDPNGEFSAVQTHGSTGYSWCAERNGKEIEGTRVRFEEAKCDREWNCQDQQDKDIMMIQEAQGLIADFVPERCQDDNSALWEIKDGNPMIDHCWCRDQFSGEILIEKHNCDEPCPPQDTKSNEPASNESSGTISVKPEEFFEFLINFIVMIITVFFGL